MKDDNTATADTTKPSLQREFSKAEAAYMQGGAEPVTSSVMISNSKYLNSPLFRDAWVQMSLRRYAPDLPDTYCIPWMIRGITDVLDIDEYVAEVSAEKERNAEFRDWLNERRISRYQPGTMDQWKPGTLGATIRSFVEDSGMSIEFTGLGDEIGNDFDYQLKRRGMTHDIEHMVTGLGPNAIGEVALAMCNNVSYARYFPAKLAHYMNINTSFVTGAAFMRDSMHYPEVMPYIYDAMRIGIEMGQALKKPLGLVQWEDYLDWKLDDIATDLGITRGPDEKWRGLDHLAHG